MIINYKVLILSYYIIIIVGYLYVMDHIYPYIVRLFGYHFSMNFIHPNIICIIISFIIGVVFLIIMIPMAIKTFVPYNKLWLLSFLIAITTIFVVTQFDASVTNVFINRRYDFALLFLEGMDKRVSESLNRKELNRWIIKSIKSNYDPDLVFPFNPDYGMRVKGMMASVSSKERVIVLSRVKSGYQYGVRFYQMHDDNYIPWYFDSETYHDDPIVCYDDTIMRFSIPPKVIAHEVWIEVYI